jgi:retron-type reverse transcriptase
MDALPESTRAAHEAEIRLLTSRGLPPAVSISTISTLFGISREFVGAMSRAPTRYYRIFQLRKGKKKRAISAPKVALKVIQNWLGTHVARAINLPHCVYGFVPGKDGVFAAASVHCGADWVYSLDLRDFFPSVSEARVVSALESIGFSADSAAFLSRLLTLNGQLPQGSPASPVISNIAFLPTDLALAATADGAGVKYTRYADDLVFSGTGLPADDLPQSIRHILLQHGWSIAEEKEHLAVRPARLKVHGLLVHGAKPRLTKGYRNRIRAYRHLLHANKICEEDLPMILGHLSYARHIERT